ncbi:hypothetical protein FA10DRAFT_268115 [Acaromyces ingoldii]|uniref:Survival motor neuron Tudor domain-containing protein n=1 Tax=Acaromyces ingoldii TaxID=215250 RepID=A0A316YL99_9BASI|nr:hypothetical protein FA10DRAFT_268115 [Acaromyces ingoldii]PWN89584.1 hypothetical protein FA10DRAFT_268115 [Acaromyces ingoldii]
MASTASRKVVSYSDLDMAAAASASTSSLAPSAPSLVASSASGKRPNWDSSGQALTASASRKLRKLLSLARGGNVEQVESMLKNDASVAGARVNEELKEAMREARRAMRGEDEEEEEEEEEGDEKEEYENDDFDEVNGGHGEVDEEMDEGGAIDSFDWQGINGGSENGSGRALTHREIWDDDALKNAWDAAVEEYEIFHRRRQEAHEQQEVSQKKRKRESALWYDSPAPGSKAALEAKTKQADEARELARRKQEAKKLVRDLAANEATPPLSKSNLSVPPSRHLASNSSAWKRACAMVAQTPNRIGPSHTSAVPSAAPSMATATRLADPVATFASADAQAAAAPSTSTPSAMSKEDTLQNLAMAWYYAGYYQAQAQALVASSSPQQQGE